jgi:hypothetical protein
MNARVFPRSSLLGRGFLGLQQLAEQAHARASFSEGTVGTKYTRQSHGRRTPDKHSSVGRYGSILTGHAVDGGYCRNVDSGTDNGSSICQKSAGWLQCTKLKDCHSEYQYCRSDRACLFVCLFVCLFAATFSSCLKIRQHSKTHFRVCSCSWMCTAIK